MISKCGRNDKNEEKIEWLSTKEAATYLRISPNALRIRVHRGEMRAYKLGHRLRFAIKDLSVSIKLMEVI